MAYWFLTDVDSATRAPASGGITRPSDGAWSTIGAANMFDVWADVDDGNGNPPADGDVIVVRSDMNETTGANKYVDFDNPLLVIASKTTAWQDYEKCSNWCLEATSAVYATFRNITSNKYCRFKGIRYKSLSTIGWTLAGQRLLFTDCDIETEKNNNYAIDAAGDGCIYVFRDSLIKNPNTTHNQPLIGTDQGSTVVLLGGECYKTRTTVGEPLLELPGGAGGSYLYAAACDFSSNPANTSLINTSSSSGRRTEASFYRSPVHSGYGLPTSTSAVGMCVRLVQCSSIYQDILDLPAGVVEAVNDVYHTSAEFLVDGVTKISYQYLSNADCDQCLSLRYGEYPSNLWFETYNDEAATKNTLRIYFVCESTDTLDDGDIIVEAIYADSTTSYKSRYACHDKHEPFEVGAALSTETTSGNWTDTGSNSLATTAYYFDLVLTSEGDGPVSWNFAIKKASVECWVSPFASFV